MAEKKLLDQVADALRVKHRVASPSCAEFLRIRPP